jgi:flagellar FliJ protein
MARFRFKLQPVLDLREREERDHQRIVAEIERSRVEIESRIREYHARIEEERRMLREQLVGGADIPGARLQANATVFLTHRADAAVVELAGVYRRLEAARRDLAHATARRRAIELLRERQHDAWRREWNRREQNELDEMSARRSAAAAAEPML